MKKLCLGLVAAAALSGMQLAGPASADDIEYPAYIPYPFMRSHVTKRIVRIVPYRRPFPVRVFTAPQRPPYYNVPEYRVISPF